MVDLAQISNFWMGIAQKVGFFLNGQQKNPGKFKFLDGDSSCGLLVGLSTARSLVQSQQGAYFCVVHVAGRDGEEYEWTFDSEKSMSGSGSVRKKFTGSPGTGALFGARHARRCGLQRGGAGEGTWGGDMGRGGTGAWGGEGYGAGSADARPHSVMWWSFRFETKTPSQDNIGPGSS